MIEKIKFIGDFPTNKGFDLTWTLTNRCNYNCNYCLVKKGNSFADISKIDMINNFRNKIRYLILFGGEPTLHPELFELLKNINCKVKLWTNLSQDLDFYLKLKDIKKNLKIICTYHSETSDLLSFVDKIKNISNIDCHIPITNNNQNIGKIYNTISKYTNKCETNPIVGISKYYNNNNSIRQKIINYEIGVSTIINNIKKKITTDNIETFLNLNTKYVICDRNKYNIDLNLDGFFYVCNNRFKTLDDVLHNNIICQNQKCNICFLNIGIKNGFFSRL